MQTHICSMGNKKPNKRKSKVRRHTIFMLSESLQKQPRTQLTEATVATLHILVIMPVLTTYEIKGLIMAKSADYTLVIVSTHVC